ncbi:MAG: site-2 protease family protein, partial [Acidimicrobiales bacterium]
MLLLSGLTVPALAGILLGMVAGITTHEFSHALVADSLGDHRPRALGRVSLNPLRHLDPLGSALLVLVGIGWGRPVPVALESLRNGKTGMAIVAACGPLANVVVALLAAAVFRAVDIVLGPGAEPGAFVLEGLYWVVAVNLLLAILNLIPIPPLDGFQVVLAVVPPRWELLI